MPLNTAPESPLLLPKIGPKLHLGDRKGSWLCPPQGSRISVSSKWLNPSGSHLEGLHWLGTHCAAESAEEGAIPPQSPFPLESCSRDAPCPCSLREGRARSIPLCAVLPWGAGEGAPWVPDPLEGSDVLPLFLCREGWEPLFPGAAATPASGSRRYPCKSGRKAARACWWRDEST